MLMDGMDSDSQSRKSGAESELCSDEANKFTQMLGLPQITLESIYQCYKEKDLNVIKLM